MDHLARYVRTRLDEGDTEEDIREVLFGHKHSQQEVDAAFAHASSRTRPIPLLVGIIMLLGVGVGVFFMLEGQATIAPVVQEPGRIAPEAPTAAIVALAQSLQQEGLPAGALRNRSLTAAIEQAQTTGDGILLCSLNKEGRNSCLIELARARLDARFCEVIGEAKSRDDCYLSLALDGAVEYCDELVLAENRQVCELLS